MLFSFVTLLLVTVLVISCFVSMFSVISPFALGVSDRDVGTEDQLIAAINDAPLNSDVAFVIAFTADIYLTDTLYIPADKNITLQSDNIASSWKLLGPDGLDTIYVDEDGWLTLDGIIVTHNEAETGRGVYVAFNGVLNMLSGAIVNNTAHIGGGVHIVAGGSFVLSGNGVIANNTGFFGGGVSNDGVFKLSDNGVIVNNTGANGGGVYSAGSFVMSDGSKISNNKAEYIGGGVCIDVGGSFVMSGDCAIVNNTAHVGGGVINSGDFVLSGNGVIANNTGVFGGGGVLNNGSFKMSDDCVVSNNTALHGGGIYNDDDGYFELTGNGIVDSNTADYAGGGVYSMGSFVMSGSSMISDNTAGSGDGVYIAKGKFDAVSGAISDEVYIVPQSPEVIDPPEIEDFMIFYNGNGASDGRVPVNNNSYISGTSVVVAANTGGLVRSGYTFLGWAYSKTATTADFTVNGLSVSPSSFIIYDDVVLYAVWEGINSTIIYDPGTHGTFNSTRYSGLRYGDATPNAPVVTGETGWNFTGWSPTPSTTVTGNATYVAQWEQITSPTPTPITTLTPTPTPIASVAPTPTASTSPTSTPTPTPIPSSPDNSATPSVENETRWPASLTLVLIIIVVISMVIILVLFLLKRR